MARFTTNKKDFYVIRKELVQRGALYIDPSFPPEVKSLTESGFLRADIPIRRIEWKRPTELVASPKFFASGASRSDLDQGMLGNCWFVAAASLIVNGPKKQFERVVPLDQGFDPNGYAGIFHFNFWWYGEWVEVIIDDYLPTDGRRLLFCYNWEQKDEFWGALLEKAYAKLRGSYDALDGGKLHEALVDMTGGLPEMIDLTNKSEIPRNLYDLMWKTSQMNSMIGGSIHLPEGSRTPEVRRNNGLYMGHAYSITALAVVPYRGSSVQLMRLRNPWGRKEWTGAWSDNSPEIRNIPMETKRKLNIVVEEDGEFWMSFDDFVANFDGVEFCHLQPDAIAQELASTTNKQNWSVTVYHDAWIRGVTAGGCGNRPYHDLYWKNPQFQIHLKDVDTTDNKGKCTVIISLMEKEKDKKQSIAIGFDIYQLRDPRRRPMDGEAASRSELIRREQSGTYQHYREVMRRFELPPGYYVIIPSTFHPHEEAEFLLRIYTEKEGESEVMDEVNSPEPTPVPKPDTLTVLFNKHAGEDGSMDFRELRAFLAEATAKELGEPITFNREACRSLLTMMDMNNSGFLSVEDGRKLVDNIKTYLFNSSGFLSLEQGMEVFKSVKTFSENRTGVLGLNEGVAMFKEIRGFVAVFKQFDTDKSDSVDTLELGSMFKKLGFPVSRMVLTSIVRRYGGRNRRISLEDFVIVMAKLILMFNIFKEQQKKPGGSDDAAQFTRNEFLQYTMFC